MLPRQLKNLHIISDSSRATLKTIIHCFSGIPGGHIPGTINLPFKKFMTTDGGRGFQVLKSVEEIKEIFKQFDVDLAKPMVITCGTGAYKINIIRFPSLIVMIIRITSNFAKIV